MAEVKQGGAGDDIDLLKRRATELRAQLAYVEDRIRRLEDAKWREFQKERSAALGVLVDAITEDNRHGETWPDGIGGK